MPKARASAARSMLTSVCGSASLRAAINTASADAGRQVDLWEQRDVGEFTADFTVEVPRHGVVFVKIGRPGENLR